MPGNLLCVHTVTGTSTVCAAKSSTEGNLLPPLSCSLTVICHRGLRFFLLYSSWSTHKIRPIWGRNGSCNVAGTVSIAWSVAEVRKCAGIR